VDYRNVYQDSRIMAEMLQLTGGGRDVPAIWQGGKLTIGFGGT